MVIGFAGIYWLVSAKNWFTGPRVQGTPEELAAIEHELEDEGWRVRAAAHPCADGARAPTVG